MKILDFIKYRVFCLNPKDRLPGIKMARCCSTCYNYNGAESPLAGYGCNLQLGKLRVHKAKISRAHVCDCHKFDNSFIKRNDGRGK